jgi:hypothetical protein
MARHEIKYEAVDEFRKAKKPGFSLLDRLS